MKKQLLLIILSCSTHSSLLPMQEYDDVNETIARLEENARVIDTSTDQRLTSAKPPLQRTETMVIDDATLNQFTASVAAPLDQLRRDRQEKGKEDYAPKSALPPSNADTTVAPPGAAGQESEAKASGERGGLKLSSSADYIDASESNQGSLKLIPAKKTARWLPKFNPLAWLFRSDEPSPREETAEQKAVKHALIVERVLEFIGMPSEKSSSTDKLVYLATYCKQRGDECCEATAVVMVYLLDALAKLGLEHCADQDFLPFSQQQAALSKAYKALSMRFEEPHREEVHAMVSRYAAKMHSKGVGEGVKFQQQQVPHLPTVASVEIGELSVEAYCEEVKIVATALLDFYCDIMRTFPITAGRLGIALEFEELLCALDKDFPELLAFDTLTVDQLLERKSLMVLFKRKRALNDKLCSLNRGTFEQLFTVLKQFEVEAALIKKEAPDCDVDELIYEIDRYLDKILTAVRRDDFSPMVLLRLSGHRREEIISLLTRKMEQLVNRFERDPATQIQAEDGISLLWKLIQDLHEIIAHYKEQAVNTMVYEQMCQRLAAVLESVIENKVIPVTLLLNKSLVLKTRELFLRPILCELAIQYRAEDTHGKQLWDALIVKTADLLSTAELLNRQELIDEMTQEDLKEVIGNRALLEKKKEAFQERKKQKLGRCENDREEIQGALAALVLKDPALVDGTIIPILDDYAHKHLLLLLTKKLLEHHDQEAVAQDLATVVDYLTKLGDDLRGVKGFQARHNHKKSLTKALEKYRATLAGAQEFLGAARQEAVQKEEAYRKGREAVEGVADAQSTLTHLIVLQPRLTEEAFEKFSDAERESQASADMSSLMDDTQADEFDSDSGGPLASVRGERNQLLQERSNVPVTEMGDRVLIPKDQRGLADFAKSVDSLVEFTLKFYDRENEKQTRELAALLSKKLLDIRIEVLNKRKAVLEIEASISWLSEQINHCERELAQLREQQNGFRHLFRDLYEIGAALYAIEHANPGFVSPTVLSQYTNPNSFWQNLYCSVM